MVSRLVKLALVTFLSITALLGVHHYRTHKHDKQVISQSESWEAARQGSPTFFDTNPFGMPGADSGVRALDDLNSHAAAYGLTPPTSMKALSVNSKAMNAAADQPSSKWNYLGLLGLLGLLGFAKRSQA